MDALFAESHGRLEEIGGLFVQLERRLGSGDSMEIEDEIAKKLDGLNK